MTNKFIYIPAVSVGSYGVSCMSNKRFKDDLPLRYYTKEMDPSLYHPWLLATAGHFYKKKNYKEIIGCDSDSILFGDSGGYQICSGAIKYEDKLLESIFNWLEENCNVGVVLDIPPRMAMAGKFDECLEISYKNYKYFADNQSGSTKYLAVLQGDNLVSYKIWYDKVKGMPLNGWCLANITSFKNMMEALSILIDNKEHKKKETNYLHFLGVSKVFDFFIFLSLQNVFNKLNYNIQITCDSSSPSNAMQFGHYYIPVNVGTGNFKSIHIPHRSKFEGKMNETELLPKFNAADEYLAKCYDYEDLKVCNNRFNSILTLHNLAVFLDAAKMIGEFPSHQYLLSQLINTETLNGMYLIEKMMIESENGSSAIEFVKKNHLMINKISSRMNNKIEYSNTFF